jgi:FixJ family two-component response regulator
MSKKLVISSVDDVWSVREGAIGLLTSMGFVAETPERAQHSPSPAPSGTPHLGGRT